MGPPETTIWEYPGERSTRGRSSSANFVDDIAARARAVPAGLEDARAALESSSNSTHSRGRRSAGESRHDHHAQPAAHHPRRRRHRPAVVLPRARRLPRSRRRSTSTSTSRCSGRSSPSIYREVLEARARANAPTRCSTRSSARRCGSSAFRTPQLEITSMADIPAGTGLGSSGSFTTALLKALHAHRQHLAPSRASSPSRPATSRSTGSASRSASRTSTSPRTAASRASRSSPTASVEAEPLKIRPETLYQPRRQPAAVLHRLLAIGVGRSSQDRTRSSRGNDPEMLDNLHFVKELGLRSRKAALEAATLRGSAS